ncbi:putative transmembrane protein, partial [Thalictrum thalictroides]
MSDSFENEQEFGIMSTSLESRDDPNAFIVDVMDLNEEEEAIWLQQSIYKLHSFIKDRNENLYEPLLVSIGPYHHGKKQLMPMEVHKHRALRHFIERSRVQIQEYKNSLMVEVKNLQKSYDQLDEEYLRNPDKFIGLMLVDGCFILEFMDILAGAPKDYAPNDPVFSYYGCIVNYNCVMRDMFLLENQLPYLVLEKLVSVSQGRDQAPQDRVRAVLSQMMMFSPDTDPGCHMLDMYMTGLFRGPATPEHEADRIGHLSASQLHMAGIQFRKITNFGGISFDRNRSTLNLPALNINEYSLSTFMNLKAYELRGTTNRVFNSYIRLMDSLVKSVEDVKLLDSHRIIMNFLESNEAVVKLLRDLAKDTVVDKNSNSYIARKEMTKHYHDIMKPWTKGRKRQVIYWISNRLKPYVIWWISDFQETYFTHPWSMLSAVAAACLL